MLLFRSYQKITYKLTATHTHTHPFKGPFSGTTRVSRYQPIWILLKQETVSGSDISWNICKSASRSRQITTPAPHHSKFFTGRMPFLPPNQQRQSTKLTGNEFNITNFRIVTLHRNQSLKQIYVDNNNCFTATTWQLAHSD